ncbi:DUF1801 domain-containing protein [Phenylobacterium sp. SCN 70-31]|uniref:iron chaperone n=1 Tax=Phenylobacterium sp. SCN 70-31 TaxID=1660129 RepID=UPI00086A8874|nr:DUF1801 domain-containing protein [Phenylobacterium sp. SCN 70-31]ODT88593.1 MAG: hypothetical protein ABS78_05350 [Phenylobacterium sp. SCN 70-31]
MVQSKAATVDDWLETVEPARRPVLEAVRAAALRNFPGLTEGMRYGMPTYAKDVTTDPAFAFNSQKQYISLYVSPRVHAQNAEALKGLDAGKSCIRFRRPEQIDLALVDKLLADTARLDAAED